MLYCFHYERDKNMALKFESDEYAALTAEEKIYFPQQKNSVIYDEDSPELTDNMEQAFIAARKAKPYCGELLDKAVNEYQPM